MGFCPICGKDTKKTFCEEHSPITLDYKDIVVRVCTCSKYFYKSRWVEFKSLKEVAKRKAIECIKDKNVKIKITMEDEELEKKEFEVKVQKDGETFIVPARVQMDRCPVCSRQGTEYFVATIQLRPKKQELFDFVMNQVEKDSDVFISKINEGKEGWDILVSTNKFALRLSQKLVKSFKGKLKTSRHHFGYDRSRSKNLYRSTICFKAEE